MRQGRALGLRYVPHAAVLAALLLAVLLVLYFNRKLAPGAEFDQGVSAIAEEPEAIPEPDSVVLPDTEEPVATVEDETEPLPPEATAEDDPAAAVAEEEPVELETDMDETTPPADNDRYRRLFDAANLPNLQNLTGPPPAITGDPETDDRIRRIAEDRGYLRRAEPADVGLLVLAEGQHYLQPEAAEAYQELKAAMAADGIIVWLTSGYRGYDRQRQIFLSRIAAPYGDDDVFELLKTSSAPGYSKHHTGYAVDLGEGNEFIFKRFVESASYRWLSADDYENARRYGWIPSYPPGVSNQGADPEPWEFVYVGRGRLAGQ